MLNITNSHNISLVRTTRGIPPHSLSLYKERSGRMNTKESIRYGVITAIVICSFYGLLPALFDILTMDFDVDFIVSVLLCAIGSFLIVGMHKKSRVSHIFFLLFFIFIAIGEVLGDIRTKGMWIVIKAGIIFYLFNSTVSAFQFHREKRLAKREKSV